jgi:hypothetical protein
MINQTFLPFSVTLNEEVGNNYSFIVNAGNVNSSILNTYKADYSNFQINSGDSSQNYYPVNSLDKPLYELGTSFLKTFNTNGSCGVYLTIPKIPAGFESFDSKVNWWVGKPPLDFLNQFRITASTDEKFQEDYENNILYTQKKDYFSPVNGTVQVLKDSEYAGKIYIKLAEVDINNTQINIRPFFRSNVLSPHRYLRLGDLRVRNIKIFFKTVAKSIRPRPKLGDPNSALLNGQVTLLETDIIPAEEDDPLTDGDESSPAQEVTIVRSNTLRASKDLRLTESSSYFYSPLFINKTIEEIESLVKDEIEKKIQFLNSTYFYEKAYIDEETTIYFRKENLQVYHIILLYKETLGDKLIIKNVYENVEAYNTILKETTKEKSNSSSINPEIKKKMTEKEAYALFGFNTVDTNSGAGVEKFVDLQGFEKK